ncbi:Poly(A)-specific ribonuclease PARN [Bienertia sinuspersici]
MAHIYDRFFGPLPSSVEEFASNIHKYFPHIVDTKVMLNGVISLQKLMNKASTLLSSAFSLLCPAIASGASSDGGVDPCVKVEWNSGAKHEASYDAFMTGCTFAQACSHLGVDFSSEKLIRSENLQNGDVSNLSTSDINEVPVINSVKRKFLNILHPNIVLLWGFSTKLKASEIKQCICKVFGIHSVASIYNLDETTVFVQFKTSDESVSLLHPLSKLLEGGKTYAAGYEVYKDICSSLISKVLFAELAEAIGINWKTKLIETVEDGQKLEPEQTASTSPSMGVSTNLKKDVQKILSTQSIFGKILYAPASKYNRQMKVTNSCNL